MVIYSSRVGYSMNSDNLEEGNPKGRALPVSNRLLVEREKTERCRSVRGEAKLTKI